MPISFNSIPNLLFVPGVYIEYDNSRANQGLPPLPNRVLLIGAMQATGTATAGTLQQITREGDGSVLFGVNSQLAWICKRFKQASKFTEVWAIGLLDAGGATAHTKTITVTGTATSAGTLHFLVHGQRVPVTVASGDTNVQVAAALVAAVAENTELLFTGAVGPTPGVDDNIVTLTATHGGVWTNDLDVRLNYYNREVLEMPEGITVAIADDVSGTPDPDVTDATDVIGDQHFTKIVVGFNGTANIAAVETELDGRWGPTVQQDAVAFYGIQGAFAALTTISDGRNSQFTVLVPPDGTSSPTPPWERAAVAAAVDSNESDPGRPRQTLPCPNVLPAAVGDRFTMTQRNLLLQAGISTFKADDGGRLLVERLVTTYTTDPASGLPDASYRNLNTMHLLAALRYTTRARFALKYPRHKLAADGTNYGPGQKVITPSVARGELLSLFEVWELNAWVQGYEQFAEELIVELNGTDPDRLDALMGPNLIKQFRVMATQIQFQ